MRAVSTNVARFVACVFVCLFGTRVSHVETTVLCSKAQLTRVLNALILTDLRVLPRDAVYVSSRVRLSVCPSVCLSQAGIVSKRLDESRWFLAWKFFPPISLWYKEMWVSPKITVLPCGTLSQTLDLENFATASRSRCQQHSSSSSTVEFVDDTYSTIDESWLFSTSRSIVTL